MPECNNCGEHVSRSYVRVSTPKADPSESPDCCPWCEDMVRRNGQPTPASNIAGRKASDTIRNGRRGPQ